MSQFLISPRVDNGQLTSTSLVQFVRTQTYSLAIQDGFTKLEARVVIGLDKSLQKSLVPINDAINDVHLWNRWISSLRGLRGLESCGPLPPFPAPPRRLAWGAPPMWGPATAPGQFYSSEHGQGPPMTPVQGAGRGSGSRKIPHTRNGVGVGTMVHDTEDRLTKLFEDALFELKVELR
ncbi:unnamed protein product [Tuber aestivum]|uniref:Uncharacterized protein n=1 Tax=Tuber aestivum TaxID=59557 RepID=A0A292Q2B2_9PEZI|nr:unnamed protein product [Tuber aestivum]